MQAGLKKRSYDILFSVRFRQMSGSTSGQCACTSPHKPLQAHWFCSAPAEPENIATHAILQWFRH